MGTTSKAFSISTPTSSDAAASTPTFMKDDKIALDERYDLEHYSLQSAAGADDTAANAAGRHIPGAVRTAYIGTTAQINALTGAAREGAVAWDTTTETLKVHDGTDWTTYTVPSASTKSKYGFSVYSNAAVSVPSSLASATAIPMKADVKDPAGVVNASGWFVCPQTGMYHFDGAVAFASLGGSGYVAVSCLLLNTGGSDSLIKYGGNASSAVAIPLSNISCNVYLTAGHIIKVGAMQDSGAAVDTYISGQGTCYFTGHLVG